MLEAIYGRPSKTQAPQPLCQLTLRRQSAQISGLDV